MAQAPDSPEGPDSEITCPQLRKAKSGSPLKAAGTTVLGRYPGIGPLAR